MQTHSKSNCFNLFFPQDLWVKSVWMYGYAKMLMNAQNIMVSSFSNSFHFPEN